MSEIRGPKVKSRVTEFQEERQRTWESLGSEPGHVGV